MSMCLFNAVKRKQTKKKKKTQRIEARRGEAASQPSNGRKVDSFLLIRFNFTQRQTIWIYLYGLYNLNITFCILNVSLC